MPDDINKIHTKIALLEKDAKTGEAIHQRLEVAIGKLSECATSIKAMLATQEQKLTKAEQTDEDIFITLESRRKSWCIREVEMVNHRWFYHYRSYDVKSKW